ncbi:MAG TPA: tetraacyldisaccharide 4'-kinase, partial [Bacillota bacterium]|nr:tetraacyldisaccharide 4'-kinase [Bacillota bacterium]
MKAGSTLENYLLAVVRGEQTGFKARLVLLGLSILEMAYWVAIKLKYFSTGKQSLPVPVISVGNITAGGTGKTPTVVWIVETLRNAGLRPAVLTRGYRGAAQNEGLIISSADLHHLTGVETGDEPYLLAKLLPGVTIAIGRDRYQMGLKALQADPDIDLFVLDDGFQFFRLQRQLDLVLLDAINPFDNRHLLPRGLLREPLSALRRAGMVLLTRSEQVDPETVEQIVTTVKRHNPQVLT